MKKFIFYIFLTLYSINSLSTEYTWNRDQFLAGIATVERGDIITITNAPTITTNITIPEGVTVISQATFNIKSNATVTVNGTLKAPKIDIGNGGTGTIVNNGTVNVSQLIIRQQGKFVNNKYLDVDNTYSSSNLQVEGILETHMGSNTIMENTPVSLVGTFNCYGGAIKVTNKNFQTHKGSSINFIEGNTEMEIQGDFTNWNSANISKAESATAKITANNINGNIQLNGCEYDGKQMQFKLIHKKNDTKWVYDCIEKESGNIIGNIEVNNAFLDGKTVTLHKVQGSGSRCKYTFVTTGIEISTKNINEDEYNKRVDEIEETILKNQQPCNCDYTFSENTTIAADELLEICSLVIKPGVTVTNYGTIKFITACDDPTLVDCDLTQSMQETAGGFNFKNYGSIYCRNFYVDPNAEKKDVYYSTPIEILNDGYIFCENDLTMTLGQRTTFTTGCDASVEAQDITIKTFNNNDINLNGIYTATNMTFDVNNGGNKISFGSNCGISDVEVKNLTLKNNVSTVNINEIAGLENLFLQTYSSVKMSVDGILTLGNVTSSNGQKLGINGNENSIIKLCYNPTHGADFGGSGQTAETKGTLFYTYLNTSDNTWYKEGEKYPSEKNSNNPATEGDVICNNCKLKPNSVTFQACMDGEEILLGISPYYTDKEIHFLNGKKGVKRSGIKIYEIGEYDIFKDQYGLWSQKRK